MENTKTMTLNGMVSFKIQQDKERLAKQLQGLTAKEILNKTDVRWDLNILETAEHIKDDFEDLYDYKVINNTEYNPATLTDKIVEQLTDVKFQNLWSVDDEEWRTDLSELYYDDEF